MCTLSFTGNSVLSTRSSHFCLAPRDNWRCFPVRASSMFLKAHKQEQLPGGHLGTASSPLNQFFVWVQKRMHYKHNLGQLADRAVLSLTQQLPLSAAFHNLSQTTAQSIGGFCWIKDYRSAHGQLCFARLTKRHGVLTDKWWLSTWLPTCSLQHKSKVFLVTVLPPPFKEMVIPGSIADD